MFAFRYALDRNIFAMPVVLDELERKIKSFTKDELEKILAEGKRYADELKQRLETASDYEFLCSMRFFDNYARLEEIVNDLHRD